MYQHWWVNELSICSVWKKQTQGRKGVYTSCLIWYEQTWTSQHLLLWKIDNFSRGQKYRVGYLFLTLKYAESVVHCWNQEKNSRWTTVPATVGHGQQIQSYPECSRPCDPNPLMSFARTLMERTSAFYQCIFSCSNWQTTEDLNDEKKFTLLQN